MCVARREDGAALVVRFATLVVFWSDARSVGSWADAYIALEGPLESSDVSKPRGKRYPDDRVVVVTHQLHRATHPEDSDPLGERRADLGMEEGGEVLSLEARELRGGAERDGHRHVGRDESEHWQQTGVVREGFVMDALCQAGDADERPHQWVKMRQQRSPPQLNRRTHSTFN